jgi:hypothetical protein
MQWRALSPSSARAWRNVLWRAFPRPRSASHVPGQLRIYTADGRADITIPSRATTSRGESDWSPIEISTLGLTLVPPNAAVAFDFAGLDSRVAAVTFSSTHPVVLADGKVVDLGALSISGIDLKSSAAKPEGALCFANDFLGLVHPLTSGDYVATNTTAPAP